MVNQISEKGKKSMLTRVITGLVMAVVMVPAILFGSWFSFVLMFLLALVATWEILNVQGKDKFDWFTKIATLLYSFLLMLSPFAFSWICGATPFNMDMTSFAKTLPIVMIPMGILLIYFFVLALKSINDTKLNIEDVTYLIVLVTLVSVGFLGLMYLRFAPMASGIEVNKTYFNDFYADRFGSIGRLLTSSILIIVCILSNMISDIGAYFTGVLFGKHHMNERISPNKTWEGFIGGCLFSYVFFFGVTLLLEYAFDLPLLPGILQYKTSELYIANGLLGGNSWIFMVIIGLLVPLVGNLGGFFFSAVKRRYGIKDYGNIFPGHGGVIDRFDSSLTLAIFLIFAIEGISVLLQIVGK